MATEEPVPTTRGQTILMHLRRGATVATTDGALGTLHQIIMDEHTGELQALVISTGGAEYLEVPATHVLRATDSDVYLDVSQTDLRLHPELVKPYNPDQYTPVRENPFLAPSEASRGAQFRERPVVTNIERDAIGVVVPTPSARAEDIVTSMMTPEPERYITEPQPSPAAPPISSGQTGEPTVADTHPPEGENVSDGTATGLSPERAVNEQTGSVAQAMDAEAAPARPADGAAGEAIASATEPLPEQAPGAAEVSVDETPTLPAHPIITPVMSVADVAGVNDVAGAEDVVGVEDVDTGALAPVFGEEGSGGLENATDATGIELDVPIEEEEEIVSMEGSVPPVNPVNPGVTSEPIQHDQHTISDILNESEHSYTHTAPPEAGSRPWSHEGLTSTSGEVTGNQLAWLPAIGLGALIVGVAAWSTMRAIRRGRRKAVKAAKTARANVRGSVRGAGKSALELARTARASATEMAASPRAAATDALGNFADIPARYRWFRRGVRVGARAARLRVK